jgi:glutamate-ammonia-ligase adenylyltransferase
VDTLLQAYRMLRIVENRLQAMDDRQTHDLPRNSEHRERLAYAMGFDDWSALHSEIAAQRSAVEAQFKQVAWETRQAGTEVLANQSFRSAWESGAIAETLVDSPLAKDEEAVRLLGELRHGGLYERMDEPSRQRLAQVVVRLLPLLESRADAGSVLSRVLPVFRAICRRSAYLSLLDENPQALDRLLSLAAQSALLTKQIAEHPLLLDELLDGRLFDTPPTRQELELELGQQVSVVAPGDIEAALEAIRQFKRTAIFRIAIADRFGNLPLMKVSDRLTDTAELVLQYAYRTAYDELAAKHGEPRCGEQTALQTAGFAIIGYGKLGGYELGYGSDLDIVFVHDSTGSNQETSGPAELDNTRFFARLAQRLIHYLTIQTSAGRLYEVDTRLRPSGGAGLMVASLDKFRLYQRTEAWTWEHQALLRSRAVAGSEAVCREFEEERRAILIGHVKRETLRGEIVKMRGRMRSELSQSEGDDFDIKQDAGGLADIEFLIDYWVLAHAHEYPELIDYPDNIRQLEALERVGLVAAERCALLKNAYIELRQRSHELALNELGRVVATGEFAVLAASVSAIWNEVLG